MRLIDADRFEIISFKDKSEEFADGVQWLAEQIDNVPTVEAIPKADYEARLKADLITMLVALQLQFASHGCKDMRDCWWLIEDKINALKAETEDQDGQTSN